MTRKLTALNSKGGVGKTCTMANLGGVLADMGARVLLFDADPQASLSKYYELEYEAPKGLVEVITEGFIGEDCISRTVRPRLHLIKCNDGDAELQHWLHTKADRRTRLQVALQAPIIEDNYDFVLIDTQGAIGNLQTAAAFAADRLLSPLPPDTLSIREFTTGTLKVLRKLGESESEPTAFLAPIQVVICKADVSKDGRELLQALHEEYAQSEELTFLEVQIPQAKAYKEAATRRLPVHEYNTIGGVRMPSGFEVMHRLAWTLYPELYGYFAGGKRADPNLVFGTAATPAGGEAEELGGAAA